MQSQGKRLAQAIKLGGYKSRAAFADALGMKAVTVRQHINRDSIPTDDAERYVRRLRGSIGLTLEWLLTGKGTPPHKWDQRPDRSPHPVTGTSATMRVEHYIGAGDEIHLFPGGNSPIDDLEAPPGFEKGAAGIVRGDSMPPFDDGDVIVWREKESAPVKNMPKRAVVVELADGRFFFKKLLPAEKGRYHLVSTNPTTPAVLNQKIETIARVGWVKFVE